MASDTFMIIQKLAKLFSKKLFVPPTVIAAASSDVGKVRKNNEDSYYCSEEQGLFIVCDGMGGHRGGEIASRVAVETIQESVASQRPLVDAVLDAHGAIMKIEGSSSSHRGRPGSTVIALQIKDGWWNLVWVGDSRAWLVEKGVIQQLTVDHTVVQQLVNWGDITAEEAMVHPEKNRLSQVLGQSEFVPVPGLVEGKLKAGMTFLLASDGMTFWDEKEKLKNILQEYSSREAVGKLVEESLKDGGHDNVTSLVVNVTIKNMVGNQLGM